MKKKKILIVSGNGSPIICGVGDYTANLLQFCHDLSPDLNFTWLCRKPRWFNNPMSSYRNISIIRPTHTWNPLGIKLTTSVISFLKPDLIHIQDEIYSYFETDAALQIAKSVECPIVVTLHEFHDELPSVKYTIELVKSATVVIANDKRTNDRCQKYTGRIPDLQGWSPTNILPGQASKKVKPISGLITTFGLISRNKQLSVIFDALQILRQQGLDIYWRIIGPFHPETNSYHQELKEQFNVSWVEFTGEFKDIQDERLQTLFAKTDVMVLPFPDGASPRRTTLQAAWAFGLPVVTTSPLPREPEIHTGINCLLVEEFVTKAWSDKIHEVLQNDELKQQLHCGSLATAKHFSWERLSKLHLQVYRDLL